MFILIAASTAMVVMVIKLARQVYQRSKYELIIQHQMKDSILLM